MLVNWEGTELVHLQPLGKVGLRGRQAVVEAHVFWETVELLVERPFVALVLVVLE